MNISDYVRMKAMQGVTLNGEEVSFFENNIALDSEGSTPEIGEEMLLSFLTSPKEHARHICWVAAMKNLLMNYRNNDR